MSKNQLALRKRWWLVPALLLVGAVGAFGATKTVEPTYQSTCGLFLSIAGDTTPAESNQASQLAQERVIAYQSLIKGERVASGAIARAHVAISAQDLVGRIETKAELSSVLIDVSVSDPEPQLAASLANAVCEEFQEVAADAEAPNQQIKVKLVQRANAPQQPISPDLTQNLAFGALVGLLAGAGLALLWERIWPGAGSDRRADADSPDDFELDLDEFESFAENNAD